MVRYNLLQLFAYTSLSASALVVPIFARDLGASYEYLGYIGAAHGVAQVLSSYLFGRLGDQIDRRRILGFGFLASALAFALQAFAYNPTTLLWTRFLAGFAVGIIPPTLAAYVYDIKRPLGKFTSFNAMGWLVGSLLIIAVGILPTYVFRFELLEIARQGLVALGPFHLLFLASALCCALGWLLTFGIPSMHLGLKVALFPTDLIRNNLHVYASVFLRHVGAAGIWVIYPLYILELGGNLAMVGWVHVVNMVSQILVLRNVERLRRIGNARVLIGIGLVLSALTFWGFTLARTATQLLPMQVPLGISFACLWLGSLKEVLEVNVERATATGLLNASISLSNLAGPLLGGFVAALYGFRATMHTAALLTLAAFALYLVMARARPRPAKPLPAVSAGPTTDVTV